jgi:flagellar hook-associated protein 2
MSSISPAATSALTGSGVTPKLAVNGLISGIDTDKVIDGLLAIDQARLTLLQAKQDQTQKIQAAFKGIEARLLSLQTQVGQLGRSAGGVFDARTVASGDEGVVTAAASGSAVPGVYALKVNALAQAHQLASQGFDSATSAITQGTFQIRSGDGTAATITVDGTNNTLQGLAAAINAAGAGVTAVVVNDGSGAGAQPFRLLLSATGTGTANRIVITNSLADSGGGATRPALDVGSLGPAIVDAGFTGTATPTVNAGTGTYTGQANGAYTFTVLTGGTVGTDNIQVQYTDATGAHTGVVTLGSGDAGVAKDVAEGIQLQLAAGTLVAGQSFRVKTYAPTVQAATDASVTVGGGAGALTVTSSTNQVDGLIPGVTLQLHGTDPQPVTLTVRSDTARAKQAIQDFVSGFNDLMSFIDDQVRYDPTSGQAGILLGNRYPITIQDQVRSVLTGVVDGASPRMNRLGALGITTDDQGKLVVNDAKLTAALDGSTPGVSLDDVRRLFALAGSSTNPGIQFIVGSTKTRASGAPYTVEITQAAQTASLTAGAALAATTTIDGTNNQFVLTVDGITSSAITLAAGTYTQAALAQALQAAVNADATLGGRKVSVGLQGSQLTIASSLFGSSSNLTIGTGTANGVLGFEAGANAQGKDVAGSFLVGGIAEPAVGSGQVLRGSPTNANTADLQLRVLLTAAQVGTGVSAGVTVTRGVASRLDQVLTGLLDPVTGRMKTIDDGLNQNVDDLQRQQQKQQALIDAHRASLQQQFATMEETLSKLQSMSTSLIGQLTSLPKQ